VAGFAELVVDVVPVEFFLWVRFTGFLESLAAGAELVLFEAGAEVAGAVVFCAAIKLTAASIVKIIGFMFVSPSLLMVNLITLREPSCAGIHGAAIACAGDRDHPCWGRFGEGIFMKERSG
jgi:hypothetical protein